ncbi:MAG: cysteine desulfurase [Rhodospirillaceae bacterium]|jgi:cysteine desulfurase|nr:cysteine desulfurase [Rhodospirillales bacterium]MBT3907941.1 cysteine desulfurase [Rhodospirillaceae bacterium]MBT4700791.1 cysteine desulfurase [Rhodospirillaceae bacterium]MBT5035274.1 cysteine desulfurase [Rhodospirillaceae bacterium]MBT6221078.1 cysteine desulfurase [Rhodospirillaceae bacterium]
MKTTVYLDHNATTPARPEAIEAVVEALSLVGNASSVHREGRAARRIIEDARSRVAALVGAGETDVVFTSGGTEANNLAIRGGSRMRVLVSAVEHLSVLEAKREVEIIPVDTDGIIDMEALERLLAKEDGLALVSVMLANNETGVIQPVQAIGEICRRYGALLHTDAVQAAGKIPVQLTGLGVDLMTLSAHKIGGPMGVGALIATPRAALTGVSFGGGQEKGLRPGTENLPAIAGFGKAAEIAADKVKSFAALAWRRNDLERRILEISPDAQIFGAGADRLPNTSCIAMPGVDSETQVMALDLDGVSVSAGSACSSGKVAISHVLEAMTPDLPETENAIRVSLGWTTEDADIDRFVEAWSALYGRLGAAEPKKLGRQV